MKVIRCVGPAPLLGTADRDHYHALFWNKNRGVENSVLFRAREFFAVEEKHRQVGVICNPEFGHASSQMDFGHLELPGRQSFAQRHVPEAAAKAIENREHHDVAIYLGRAQFYRL